MHVHFIAIGGSAMHNLAIALHRKGFRITGSDDEIFEPARSRLQIHGLLPAEEGWFPERIDPGLDAVILGMHARIDNPELVRARELGLKIFSYPEYLYEQSRSKKRIVVGGSHGKTTITAMILHVLQYYKTDCDFMVGAQLEGFDIMVKLSESAPLMIMEGDEYLTSPIDRRPKFHLYHPDLAILSGIAWDHINVFPTFEEYCQQFRIFIETITPDGLLVYCSDDPILDRICKETRQDIEKIPYSLPEHTIRDCKTILQRDGTEYPLQIFGRHNLLNLNGARIICSRLGIGEPEFNEAIMGFKGAARRLERIADSPNGIVYKDFAHAPSKVKATLSAIRDQYPASKIVACLELHTYSSLNKAFLPEYKGSMDGSEVPLVYFNPHALQIKRLPGLDPADIAQAFDNPAIEVFNDSHSLIWKLRQENGPDTVYLMMSSGNYDGMELQTIINHS
jgi:UDP-N-acetylmuramate: L-alanyl-gamma-D-glutamyl-meso-diaminopimelate ligase